MADSNDDTTTLTITPRDRDLMVRTLVGEAGGQPDLGKSAVAHVIMNRAIDGGYGGSSPTDVVLAPNQFEPWSTRSNELMAISPNSRQYRNAAAIVDSVLSGETPDPTNGSRQFLNPTTVMRRSGRLPKWAQGNGTQIGAHVFLDGPSPPAPQNAVDAISAATGSPAQAGQGTVPPGALAFDANGPVPQTGGKMPSGTPAGADPAKMSDDDLAALIAGKPSDNAKTGSYSISYAPTPDVHAMSDDDLAKLISGPAPAPKPGAKKPALTPEQVASGIDPETGERVVGGKPFTSDSSYWSGWRNFANGALQGGATSVMAGAQALKEKLVNDNPLPVNKLFDQAKSTYEGGREGYAASNPISAAIQEGGGSLATALPLMALGGAGLARGGNMLMDSARAVPGLARAVPAAEALSGFVGGTAGVGRGLGNMLLRGASRATQGAVQGAGYSTLASNLSDRPLADQVRQGAEFGAAVGVGLPAVVGAGKAVVNKLLGSGTVEPAAAALAKTAQDTYGIPIRGGQLAESPGVRVMDSTLSRMPGMGYAADNAAQSTAFNKAVAKTFGEATDKITPTVMSAAKARIGGVMNDVAANTTVHQDPRFVSDLTQIANDAKGVLAQSELKPLQTQARNIVEKFGPDGAMTGEAYQAITRNGAPLDRLMNSSDSNVKFYAGRIRDALDDALERSASPEDLARLREARGQYKNMKTIEPLVGKSTTGSVSPALLMQAVLNKYDMAYAGSGGPLGDLARIGKKFLQEPTSSNTSERLSARGVLNSLGSLGAGAFGIDKLAPYIAPHVAPEAIPYTLASMAGSFGAGRVASSVLRSPTYANMLINSSLGFPQQSGPVNRLLGIVPNVAPQIGALSANRLLSPPPASP